MVSSKILPSRCFDDRCTGVAEYLFFAFWNPTAKRRYSFVTYYCKHHQYLDIVDDSETWWDFERIFRLCSLLEKGYSYKDITDMLNREFDLHLHGNSTPKGFKGTIVKKFEHLKQNHLDWENIGDENLLILETHKVFAREKEKNRYGLLRDRRTSQS